MWFFLLLEKGSSYEETQQDTGADCDIILYSFTAHVDKHYKQASFSS